MDRIQDHLADQGGALVFRTNGLGLDAFERRLGGTDLDRLSADLGLGPEAVVAGLAGLGLQGEGPPLVQGPPPRPRLLGSLTEAALAALWPASTRSARLALSAGLLQVHDFWDASHQAAQEADDLGERSVSAYWHGIAHRREPDPGNAAYWFRRVGRHELFGLLGAAAQDLLERLDSPEPGTERLVRGGQWDLFAFLDFCRLASARPESATARLARQLQRLEMDLLLGLTVRRL